MYNQNMIRAHLIISGRVQGVFYRAFTEDIARGLNLKGWVRNTPNGDVEAVFEGEKSDIEKAIEHLKKGPPAAIVKNINISWEDFKGEFKSFEIRYF